MKLSWRPSVSTSAIHAAYALLHLPPLTDGRVSEAIRPSAQVLSEFVRHLPKGVGRTIWSELLCWSNEIESNRDLAEHVLTRLLGTESPRPSQVGMLAGSITDLEASYTILFPRLNDQLELRSRPLRETWEGFGNGLLAHIGRLTDRSLLVEQADVILVQPVLGGFGMTLYGESKIYMEALLANAIPELPEVVRLAWLLAQLKMDHTNVRTGIREGRVREIAGLAMLPAALAAGQLVELTRIDEPNVALAIEHWQIPVPQGIEIAPSLVSWWETYLQTRPEWSVALTALDRMLQAG